MYASNIMNYYYQPKLGNTLQQRAQKCDRFWFVHILSYRFNPIRSQLETVLDFWLVNVCMKECELIKCDHTFGLPVVKCDSGFRQEYVFA